MTHHNRLTYMYVKTQHYDILVHVMYPRIISDTSILIVVRGYTPNQTGWVLPCKTFLYIIMSPQILNMILGKAKGVQYIIIMTSMYIHIH